jgi:molecular chaperone GrpE
MSEDQSLQEDTGKKPQAEPEQAVEGELIDDDTLAELEALSVDEEEEPAVGSTEQLTEQLAGALQRAEQYRDQALRTQADMENLRRRTEKEIQDARKFALERFSKDLLVVLDSLELGIQAAVGDAPEVAKHREGSELTLKQFLSVLEKYNVRRIEAQGQKFDPNLHQAITMEPTDEVEPNTVTKVFQQGYTINDRLLRPAMVVIAQKKA